MNRTVLKLVALLVCSALAIATGAPRSPASSTTMSGTLTSKDGEFYLTDEASNSTVEVRGEGLEKYLGQKVSVTGQVSAGPEGSPVVLNATQVSRAAALGGKAAAAGVKSGLSRGAIFGIAGGGVAAATAGALYATGVFNGSSNPASRQ